MGSGPGPERIGSGRHRLCGARVSAPASGGRAGMSALPQFSVCPGQAQPRFACGCDETVVTSSRVRLEHREMRGNMVSLSLNPEPSSKPTYKSLV